MKSPDDILWWAVTGLLGLVLMGMTWWVKNIWAMVIMQGAQIQTLNIELAKNYVPRAELQATFERIFNMLGEISKEVRQQNNHRGHDG